MGSLGDVARGLCLVNHIKTNLPLSRVTWLVESKWSELVGLNRQIDRMIIFKRAWRWSAIRGLFKDLRQDHYDITLDLQRIFKSGLISLFSGAKRRIGFHRRNAKEFNWVFNNEHIGYYSDGLPKIYHYLKFTEYLGLPEPENLDFGLSPLDPSEAAPELIGKINQPFIVVVLGSSWENKNWHAEGYAGLIQRILADLSFKVVLVGNGFPATLAATLTEKFKTPNVIDMVGQTSLGQLAALLKAAAAGVGPDSGPGHVATAVKTPFVTLFGPTSPQRTAPFGNHHLVVDAGSSCVLGYKKRYADRNKQCMNSIHPDAVMEKVSLALKEQVRD
jgi:ADP-heptose:LPS heptosyltransferase